jgi:hypothetical protein
MGTWVRHGDRGAPRTAPHSPPFAEGEQVHLPAIASRLVPKLNPSSQDITERGVRWAREFIPFESDADRDRFIEQAHCAWTCMLFPAGLLERVQDICDLTLFLFATDDAYVKSASSRAPRKELDRLRELAAFVARGETPASSNPWRPGFEDVWGRLQAQMPRPQLERVARGILALYGGAAREVAVRTGGDVPRFEDYMRLRKDSVGAKIYFVLCEYAIGVDLSEEAADPALQAVLDAASEHLILTNDVFSFRKECSDGDDVNAVAVMYRHSGLPLQRIVNELCATIELREREFMQLRADLLASSLGRKRGVGATLEGLGHLLSGNLRWSYLTPRYHPDRTRFHAS